MIVILNYSTEWLMKLSTRGRYGLRAMLDLSLHAGEGPILVRDISRRQDISDLYLAQLFSRLKTAWLVRSIRGPKGGFMLTKPPSQIRLIEIVEAMEGSSTPVECVEDAAVYSRGGVCLARTAWLEIKKAIGQVLESTTLHDLAVRGERDQVRTTPAYRKNWVLSTSLCDRRRSTKSLFTSIEAD